MSELETIRMIIEQHLNELDNLIKLERAMTDKELGLKGKYKDKGGLK